MSNSPKVKKSMEQAVQELLAMKDEDFDKLFEDHKNGVYAKILREANTEWGNDYHELNKNYNNLKCCGNCNFRIAFQSLKHPRTSIEGCSFKNKNICITSMEYCDKWKYDEFSNKERKEIFNK